MSGTTMSSATRPRSRPLALITYTLQSCIPPRRWAAVLVSAAAALFFGVLARVVNLEADRAFANVASEGILGLIVPVAALVVGDAVLGAELRAGSFYYTWLTTTPTSLIVLARWCGGTVVTLVTMVPAVAFAAVIAGSPDSIGPIAMATACQCAAYVALFIAIGCLTQRTAVWALAVVFLVERLLGAALTGIAQLSPTWLARAIFVGLLDDPPDRLVRSGIPEGGGAIIRLAIVTAVAVGVASWRMRHLRLSGAAD